MNPSNIYPRTGDTQTVYLNQVVTDSSILVGNYTMYNDFVHNPVDFEKNNVIIHIVLKTTYHNIDIQYSGFCI